MMYNLQLAIVHVDFKVFQGKFIMCKTLKVPYKYIILLDKCNKWQMAKKVILMCLEPKNNWSIEVNMHEMTWIH